MAAGFKGSNTNSVLVPIREFQREGIVADPKEVHVKVFLHPTSNPKFHFETSDLPLGPDNSLTFENHGHPGFYVHYDLQEPIHGHLFPGDTIDDHLDEALFSKAQSSCPSTKGQWGQFKAKEVTN